MGLTSTLAGRRLTRARVALPAWGCWYADASVDDEVELAGAVELQIADLTLRGTVLSGGPSHGRSHFRIAGGGGGWGRTIRRESYRHDAGVALATVLTDAAQLAGETIDMETVGANAKVPPGWARPEGPACRTLERVAPGAWYVGEDGVTRLGRRPRRELPVQASRGPVDRARGTVTIAAESIASIVPGVVVDGLEAVDVEHELSAAGGLRSTIWGARAAQTSRRLAALRAIVDQLDPDRAFRGLTEFRVVTLAGDRLNLQPVRVSTGMPDLRSVPVRPGLAGSKSTMALGARVLVAFVDASPGRPAVVALEDAAGEGFLPVLTEIDAQTIVRLGAGARPAIAAGDLAGIFPCVPTQAKVLI